MSSSCTLSLRKRVANVCLRSFQLLQPALVWPHVISVFLHALAKPLLMVSASTPDPPFAVLIRGCWFATVVVMSERSPEQIDEQIRELLDSLYRVDSGRILATLIRLLGDF